MIMILPLIGTFNEKYFINAIFRESMLALYDNVLVTGDPWRVLWMILGYIKDFLGDLYPDFMDIY